MTLAERRIGAGALRAVLAALQAAGIQANGDAAADLRRIAGALSAAAEDAVEASTFSTDLRACFTAATTAGATFEGMDRVRTTAIAAAIVDTLPVRRVTETCVRYALVEMGRIVAGMTFASRQDVDATLVRINAAFAPSEEFAADQRSTTVYRALVGLHAAVVRDLTQRSRPLPRVIRFDVGQSLPNVTLANRLYGDADRSGELVRENKVRHPLFMPLAGQAFSA